MSPPAALRSFSIAFLLLASACGSWGGGVRVLPLGPAAEPRPEGCALEILEQEPVRPHERLAELVATTVPSDGWATAAPLRPAACRLGADAILLTHRSTPRGPRATVAGVALRWLPSPAPAPEPPPDREPPRPPPGGVDL